MTEQNGEELEIVRHGLLRRMLGVSGDGLHDRLMKFTRAVSGASFSAPSLRLFRSLGAD